MVANSGIGDVDNLINGHAVGAIVRELSDEGYSEAIDQIARLEDPSEECRRVAREHFDLEQVGGVRYRRLYRNLLDV